MCNESARIASATRLISATESAYVRSFYLKCIANLRKEDRALNQVQEVLNLLVTGVGVHHAGLLPLLKEIVEMLFSSGYIKLLFATETFAVGINMPEGRLLRWTGQVRRRGPPVLPLLGVRVQWSLIIIGSRRWRAVRAVAARTNKVTCSCWCATCPA